jgi:hypothetical protein
MIAGYNCCWVAQSLIQSFLSGVYLHPTLSIVFWISCLTNSRSGPSKKSGGMGLPSTRWRAFFNWAHAAALLPAAAICFAEKIWSISWVAWLPGIVGVKVPVAMAVCITSAIWLTCSSAGAWDATPVPVKLTTTFDVSGSLLVMASMAEASPIARGL